MSMLLQDSTMLQAKRVVKNCNSDETYSHGEAINEGMA